MEFRKHVLVLSGFHLERVFTAAGGHGYGHVVGVQMIDQPFGPCKRRRALTRNARAVPVQTWQEGNVRHSGYLVFVELGEQVFGVHVHVQFFRDDRGRVDRHRAHHPETQVFRVLLAVVLQHVGDARQVHLLRVYNTGTTVARLIGRVFVDRCDSKHIVETKKPNLPNSRPSMSKMT